MPLVTPFTDDGATLSEVRLARLVRQFVAQGVDGFAICTDTGEFMTLSFSERKSVLELVVRESQGALPVLVHVSTLSTSPSLDLAQHAARHGARAAIIMPPYYGALSQSEMVEHIRCVAVYSSFTIIVVDPLAMLTLASLKEIGSIPHVTIAGPGQGHDTSASDWFEVDGVRVSPTALFPEYAGCFKKGSRAAVAKALMETLDLEVGRPRMPIQPIRLADLRSAA